MAGAGLSVMLSCDLVVADPGTKFVFAFPSIGLTPDWGVSWLLPRAVGPQRALAFALSGRPLPATDAVELGMVTELADEPGDRARELATGLASGPAGPAGAFGAFGAFGATRHLLREPGSSTAKPPARSSPPSSVIASIPTKPNT